MRREGIPYTCKVLLSYMEQTQQNNYETVAQELGTFLCFQSPQLLNEFLPTMARNWHDPKNLYAGFVLLIIFHTLRRRDLKEVSGILLQIPRKWIPTFEVGVHREDVFWIDFCQWKTDRELYLAEKIHVNGYEEGLESVAFGTIVGMIAIESRNTSKGTHYDAIPLISELVLGWSTRTHPILKHPDPLNALYFGVSVFANYVGYISQPERGKTNIPSNSDIAAFAGRFAQEIHKHFESSLELTKFDMMGLFTFLIAETTSRVGRRWHDFDLIEKMTTSLTSLDNPKFPWDGKDLSTLSKLIGRKFSLISLVKQVYFPRWFPQDKIE
eukprot:TRINITY_DN460_c0_g1_i3.p1 TRINITY_DN460_c0_g1~~TRINITY_DN460_c0_g1_i3.p1  ORF type:complete len:326 (-),score=64.09 TRINITY_DN460_c0_g1_i3:247-1224(-)